MQEQSSAIIETTPYYQNITNEEEIFRQAWQHQLPVLIKGPTGCGKTRFVQYMAHALNLPCTQLPVMTT